MVLQDKYYRTIWLDESSEGYVCILDQRDLPFSITIRTLKNLEDAACAIENMTVRGAPQIGGTAAFAFYLALREMPADMGIIDYLDVISGRLAVTRPTAVDLFYAIDIQKKALSALSDRPYDGFETFRETAVALALKVAQNWCQQSIEECEGIGRVGVEVIRKIFKKTGKPVQILTHCNAGWLACIDIGTATAPIYAAQKEGIPLHVWVDETRPRNQGSRLTAFELQEQKIPFTLITDNAGGHIMQHGLVDMVLVGTDRTTAKGDVANKIGTYLKALAAFDNQIPFYVGLPISSLDVHIGDGLSEIPIEERSSDEIHWVAGWNGEKIEKVRISPFHAPAANYGFDVTPARLITGGLITAKGICPANEADIKRFFGR
jgi:methylthioribose-1-phosphate isomerase